MAREMLCSLSFDAAIKAIEEADEVYYRHGVWNEWQLKKCEAVKKSIVNSGYGADVFKENGKLYVSVPCGADMW